MKRLFYFSRPLILLFCLLLVLASCSKRTAMQASEPSQKNEEKSIVTSESEEVEIASIGKEPDRIKEPISPETKKLDFSNESKKADSYKKTTKNATYKQLRQVVKELKKNPQILKEAKKRASDNLKLGIIIMAVGLTIMVIGLALWSELFWILGLLILLGGSGLVLLEILDIQL